MITRLVVIATITGLLGSRGSQAQVVPSDCSPPSAPDAIRLALLISLPNDLPFSGIGQVSIRGAARGQSRQEEAQQGFLEYWYCSAELPRGRYTVEVRTLTFDCTAISLSQAETGLVVRLIRLRPDPWRPLHRDPYRWEAAVDPHMSLLERLGSRRCGVNAG